jgi:flagellar protein FlaG
MELTIGLEGNPISQGLQPKAFDYSSACSAPPQVRQQNPEKTKAESEKQTASEQETLTAVRQANKLMELFNRDLRFETHSKTGIVQISVVDRKDGKVVKQIPPDSVLDMIIRIREILGSLIDIKA